MRIGVDLGGTKIAAIRLGGGELPEARRRVPAPEGYAATVAAIGELVDGLDPAAECTVGVATPGSPAPETGLMINAKNTPLDGRAFGADLEAALGRAVRVANDANCFALSEAVDGAAAGASVVVGVIVGTGVGAGVVIDGRVLAGAHGVAGEWGHNSLPWPSVEELASAPPCTCGKRGCVEAWLSGPAMARDHARVTGETHAAAEIARRAEAGDVAARSTLARFSERLGRALASLVNVLDPAVIVLGGGVSNVSGLAESAAEHLPAYVFADRVRTRVVRNRHGDASGVRGAAWLWPRAGDPPA